ncbi:hypothetical protein N7466_007318 [Penicillium verhagenii]|uniref:uncharacterized protein n=1 Tax=Penicillium verhagenii TaxID=1562060 RepID=UPI0025451400|nr:uncharacterized protein N7466_007318 [Penicillium verhagenii]KAJ5928362.1 hypothetical protein N7466_007318 [Penicillium verhagenii]
MHMDSEPGSAKTNPIVIEDEAIISEESVNSAVGPCICCTKEVNALIDSPNWPLPNVEEELSEDILLSLGEWGTQQAEMMNSDISTGVESNPFVIYIDDDWCSTPCTSQAHTGVPKNDAGYLDCPPTEVFSPPVTSMIQPKIEPKDYELVSAYAHYSGSGTQANPIVIGLPSDLPPHTRDEWCDSTATPVSDNDTEAMNTPDFWASLGHEYAETYTAATFGQESWEQTNTLHPNVQEIYDQEPGATVTSSSKDISLFSSCEDKTGKLIIKAPLYLSILTNSSKASERKYDSLEIHIPPKRKLSENVQPRRSKRKLSENVQPRRSARLATLSKHLAITK